MKIKWTSVNKDIPQNNGDYLCVLDAWGHKYIRVCKFTKNLEEIDDLDFRGESGSGFYDYDSEYGYFKRDSVTHWMPLPALPELEEQ